MLAIIYKLLSGIVVHSRKTNKTASVQLNLSVFFFFLFIFGCLGFNFFPCGKDKKVKKKCFQERMDGL